MFHLIYQIYVTSCAEPFFRVNLYSCILNKKYNFYLFPIFVFQKAFVLFTPNNDNGKNAHIALNYSYKTKFYTSRLERFWSLGQIEVKTSTTNMIYICMKTHYKRQKLTQPPGFLSYYCIFVKFNTNTFIKPHLIRF